MPRIVGGIDAEEREFPWTVYLEETITLRLCAGSIIDRRHVVTAAHCVRYVNIVNYVTES